MKLAIALLATSGTTALMQSQPSRATIFTQRAFYGLSDPHVSVEHLKEGGMAIRVLEDDPEYIKQLSPYADDKGVLEKYFWGPIVRFFNMPHPVAMFVRHKTTSRRLAKARDLTNQLANAQGLREYCAVLDDLNRVLHKIDPRCPPVIDAKCALHKAVKKGFGHLKTFLKDLGIKRPDGSSFTPESLGLDPESLENGGGCCCRKQPGLDVNLGATVVRHGAITVGGGVSTGVEPTISRTSVFHGKRSIQIEGNRTTEELEDAEHPGRVVRTGVFAAGGSVSAQPAEVQYEDTDDIRGPFKGIRRRMRIRRTRRRMRRAARRNARFERRNGMEISPEGHIKLPHDAQVDVKPTVIGPRYMQRTINVKTSPCGCVPPRKIKEHTYIVAPGHVKKRCPNNELSAQLLVLLRRSFKKIAEPCKPLEPLPCFQNTFVRYRRDEPKPVKRRYFAAIYKTKAHPSGYCVKVTKHRQVIRPDGTRRHYRIVLRGGQNGRLLWGQPEELPTPTMALIVNGLFRTSAHPGLLRRHLRDLFHYRRVHGENGFVRDLLREFGVQRAQLGRVGFERRLEQILKTEIRNGLTVETIIKAAIRRQKRQATPLH